MFLNLCLCFVKYICFFRSFIFEKSWIFCCVTTMCISFIMLHKHDSIGWKSNKMFIILTREFHQIIKISWWQISSTQKCQSRIWSFAWWEYSRSKVWKQSQYTGATVTRKTFGLWSLVQHFREFGCAAMTSTWTKVCDWLRLVSRWRIVKSNKSFVNYLLKHDGMIVHIPVYVSSLLLALTSKFYFAKIWITPYILMPSCFWNMTSETSFKLGSRKRIPDHHWFFWETIRAYWSKRWVVTSSSLQN